MNIPTLSLKRKAAVVTGCNRGVGYGIASAMAAAGADVALVDREVSRLQALAAEIESLGPRAIICETDITREDAVIAMVRRVLDAFGSIEVLVNNAGIVHRTPAEETTYEQWRQTIDVNQTGTFLCGREIGKAMIRQKSGKIINMASINSVVARPNLAAYGASKSAVTQLTRCWALEWARHNINVNAVAPSFVMTEMTRKLFSDPEIRRQLLERVPLGRIGSIEDVAGAVLFLASEVSNYITGQTLFVDGGWTIQ
jgi:NAD(P)-dependent dehydrogenase (short-subunit alcohol dehydrogenase family)